MTGLLPPDLLTPASVVLVERLDRNLERMASLANERLTRLRPHAKTHKCREIARRQIKLGAVGLSVATLGEAEVLVSTDDAIEDVFIAYPFWLADDSFIRLRSLASRATVAIGVDSAEAAERLERAAGLIRILIEVDSGLGRSGVVPIEVVNVARAAERAGLYVAGVFTFPGHSYSPGASSSAAADEESALMEAAECLRSAGFASEVLSGGSTPSAAAIRKGALTEMRPGVYVFNDAQQLELGVATMDDVALMVAGTVVSRASGRIVLDAGSKVLGPDRPAWATGYGRLAEYPDARITALWEHHAVVQMDGPCPRLGEQVAVVPNHVCTAVNLVPNLLVVSEGQVVDTWTVPARAANR